MTKAFFYDTLCGMVYRCMFAGLDIDGKAHWVVITPGEESKTLEDVVIDEELGEDTRFLLIAMEGEPVQPIMIARLLGKIAECPVGELGCEIAFALRRMKQFGMKWSGEPLELDFRVMENSDGSRRRGKYSFWVMDRKDEWGIIADIDGFDDLDDVFDRIRHYLMSLELSAEIPVIDKDLSISNGLKKLAGKNYLRMFTHISVERELVR